MDDQLPPLPTPSSSEQIRALQAAQFYAYDEVRQLPSAEREALFELLLRAQAGDSSVVQMLYGLVYDEMPVPFEEFLRGRRYLALPWINDEKLFILQEFTKPHVRKLWCAAGKGSGKSFMVSVVQAWEIYNLLCLKRPDMFYMLGPGSKIATVNLSVAKDQSKDVVFSEFLGRLDHSPWFKGKYDPQAQRCIFAKNIFALSGGQGAISYYGYNTKMGTVDEASFLLDRDGRSLADELTEALLGSLTTRFPTSYKLMVISTLRAEDDYLAVNIERVKTDGTPLLVTHDAAV